MKTVWMVLSLVYGISWSILLLIYLYSKFFKKKSKAETFFETKEKAPWYFYVLLVTFSPIVVLYIPYITIRDAIRSIKLNKWQKEQDKIKEQKDMQKKKTIKNFEECSAIPIQADCIEKGRQLKHIAAEQDYQRIFDCLNHLHLPDGCTLQIEPAKDMGMGDHTHLYVTDPSGEDLDLFNTIMVEDSPIGAIEVYLLHELWHYLPLFWHANYALRKYIYSTEDLKDIRTFDRDKINSFVEKPEQFEVSPIIKKDKNRYYISCCYWTNWGGLIRELVAIEIKNNKIADLIETKLTTLYKYECGVLF